jgi:hypothetical protein
MHALLYGVIAWAMGGAIARFLVGAGLSVVVYTGITTGVTALLDNAVTAVGGLPADILSLVLLTGVGESLSIMGAAILSRVALAMAGNVAGLKRTT